MATIDLTIANQVATLTINNPVKLNCLTWSMLEQLEHHLISIEKAIDEVCLCVLKAAPAKAFCAGADIGEWSSLSARDFSQNWLRQGNRIFSRLAQLPMPTMAVIETPVMGGGMELIACCDYRLASENTHFSLPETGIGVIPGWSGTQRLGRLIPETLLKSMVLFGQRISAQQMAQCGFAETVADVPARTQQLMDLVVKRAPEANRIAKLMIHAGAGENVADMVDALGGGLSAASADKAIGVQAFLNKQTPVFWP